jgi:hypothetical protein
MSGITLTTSGQLLICSFPTSAMISSTISCKSPSNPNPVYESKPSSSFTIFQPFFGIKVQVVILPFDGFSLVLIKSIL